MSAPRADQRGFTLIELMIVVALIAILAAIVVPMFMGESRQVKGDSEVAAIFAELRVREEAYKVEHGTYLATGATEGDTYPAAPSAQLQTFANTLPSEWTDLHFLAPESEARCAYVARTGAAGDPTGAVAQAAPFAMDANPTVSWYYLLAHCDMNGDGGGDGDSYYFTSSMNTEIQRLRPAH